MSEREELLKKIRQQIVDHNLPFFEDIWERITLTDTHVLRQIAESNWYADVKGYMETRKQ